MSDDVVTGGPVSGATQRREPVRVAITSEAAELLRRLRARHGPLMFHQSGGCCDGSSPMCFPRGEFLVGDDDVLLGLLSDDVPVGVGDGEAVEGRSEVPPRGMDAIPEELTPVWISGPQYAAWKHTQLLLDVVAGRGGGFSLEAPEGVRFLTRSRVFDEAEQQWLENCPAPRGRDLDQR